MLRNEIGQFAEEAAIARFLRSIRISETECWEWMGARNLKGYGQFKDGKQLGAHRFSYRWFKGEIPEGLQIDHLCRNRACVNPDHLQVVSGRDNVLRGIGITANNARKMHCLQGHPYDLFNTYIYPNGSRCCRICTNSRAKAYRSRNGNPIKRGAK